MSSGVEFDEDKINYGGSRPGDTRRFAGYNKPIFAEKQPRMVRWLMDHGLAVSPGAANAILIGIVIVNLVIIYLAINYFL